MGAVTFSCTICMKQWESDAPVHFHRCRETYAGDEDYRPRFHAWQTRAERGAVWYVLLEQVGEEQTWRR